MLIADQMPIDIRFLVAALMFIAALMLIAARASL